MACLFLSFCVIVSDSKRHSDDWPTSEEADVCLVNQFYIVINRVFLNTSSYKKEISHQNLSISTSFPLVEVPICPRRSKSKVLRCFRVFHVFHVLWRRANAFAAVAELGASAAETFNAFQLKAQVTVQVALKLKMYLYVVCARNWGNCNAFTIQKIFTKNITRKTRFYSFIVCVN